MEQHDIDEFLERGLSTLHMKLMLYLLRNEPCYVHDVVKDNPKLYRRFVELALIQKSEIYARVELPPISVLGNSRPRTSGIQLTKLGKQLAQRIASRT